MSSARLKKLVFLTILAAVLVWVGVGFLWLRGGKNSQATQLPLGTTVVEGVTFEVIKPDELIQNSSSKGSSFQQVVLDLRNSTSFQKGHYPGAVQLDPAAEDQQLDIKPIQKVFLYSDEAFLESTNWQYETQPLILEKLRARNIDAIKIINQPYGGWKSKVGK